MWKLQKCFSGVFTCILGHVILIVNNLHVAEAKYKYNNMNMQNKMDMQLAKQRKSKHKHKRMFKAISRVNPLLLLTLGDMNKLVIDMFIMLMTKLRLRRILVYCIRIFAQL